MSVEAISWALNLAPVPRDGGGKRNSACKAVLVGLANHAGPDGTGAFPSVRTLVRYTDLSERTVRTALDRLAAEGIIRPCDPAVIAAKIKRPDQRPQGWDLAMHLIRHDLDEADLAALEPQFPGLTSRVRAGTAPDGYPDDGVQPLYPAPGTAVDNVTHGVQPSHPGTGTGCNHRSNGVQPFPERGAAAAPEPPIEPSIEPSTTPAHDHGVTSADTQDRAAETAGAGEFFAALGPRWLLTVRQSRRLAPSVTAALAAGWTPATLAEFAGANTAGVRNPYAVLAARLSPDALPAPVSQRPPARPAWCGQCNQDTRRMEGADGIDAGRCPRCHPLAADGAGATGRAAGSFDGGLTQTAVSGVQTSARDAHGGRAPRAQPALARDGASLRPGRSWLWAAGTAWGGDCGLGGRPRGRGPGQIWVSAARDRSGSRCSHRRQARRKASISLPRAARSAWASAYSPGSGRKVRAGNLCWLAMIKIIS